MIILFGGEEGASAVLLYVLVFAFERSTKIIRSIILPVLIYIRFFIYAWTLKAGGNSPDGAAIPPNLVPVYCSKRKNGG